MKYSFKHTQQALTIIGRDSFTGKRSYHPTRPPSYDLAASVADLRIEDLNAHEVREACTREHVSRRLFIDYWLFCRSNFIAVTDYNRMAHDDYWKFDAIARRRIDVMLNRIETEHNLKFEV